jgi:hypothetical protein
MKLINKLGVLLFASVAFSSCQKYLDPWEYTLLTENLAFSLSTYIDAMPNSAYGTLTENFTGIYMPNATDESENADELNAIQAFNSGTWNKFNNPDDIWATSFRGIRIIANYLNGTDTLAWSEIRYPNPITYGTRIKSLCRDRGEMRFLRAFLYFELIKRYGDVPLIRDKVDLATVDISKYGRMPVDSIIEFIVKEIDICTSRGAYALTQAKIDELMRNNKNALPSPYRDTVAIYYASTGTDAARQGRPTLGSALALKAKALVYAASPQFNPTGNVEKWKRAAQACNDVMKLPQAYYSLQSTYAALFQMKTVWSNEFLFARKFGVFNTFEAANFPISIPGGKTGTCPSAELVDDHEMLDGTPFSWSNPVHAANPYNNRDPRLKLNILTNMDKFNGVTPIECWTGGNAGPNVFRGTKTGYYLKKYVNQALDLTKSQTGAKILSVMRLGEFYLFYAEAMNEAYGPDADPLGYGMTALAAINKIRNGRTDVKMPSLLPGLSKDAFRQKLMHERRIELAFENVRYWDLRRWKIAENYLNGDIHGVEITKTSEVPLTFNYQTKVVEKRVFDATKMYLYPIPQTEIDKAQDVLTQNPNW